MSDLVLNIMLISLIVIQQLRRRLESKSYSVGGEETFDYNAGTQNCGDIHYFIQTTYKNKTSASKSEELWGKE